MRVIFQLCCLLGFCFSTPAWAQTLDCQKLHCLAVIDAGSSGSRLHIYTYDRDAHQTPVNIVEKWVKKVYPGFALLENSQQSVDEYLSRLFTDAPETQAMPVYFYATAGMRLLPQPKQEQLYQYLRNWFDSKPQWILKKSKTITGREEGLFGWLAVNYQLGTLSSDNKPPVGVMDMGGVSVQVVFPVTNTGSVDSEDIQHIDLYGHRFNLFIHSFLGLGQTEVIHQFLDSSPCFVNDYPMPDGALAKGDARACEKEVSYLINQVHHTNAIVQPILEANPVSEWYALSGVVELAKSKPFNFEKATFTNQALLNQGDEAVCQQQWPSLKSQFPSNDYLYGYCLFPAYYYALMVDGYGLQPEQPIHFIDGNQNGDWTMGVVLRD